MTAELDRIAVALTLRLLDAETVAAPVPIRTALTETVELAEIVAVAF